MKLAWATKWWAVVLAMTLLGAPGQLLATLPAAAANGGLAFSFSGQFIVTSGAGKSPLLDLPSVTTNASFIHLEPAVLSVSAERLKQSLYHLLGIPSPRNWQGKIFLALHPALWTDENVTVVSRPIDRSWSYLVQLPNVVAADRYLRSMTGVLLLEYANRRTSADGHCAEVPDWLIDGLARQMKHEALADVMLAAPDRAFNHPTSLRSISTEQDLDPLVQVRQVLRRHQALTFAELCWPTQAQLAGDDGGAYQASAQLFVVELLKMNDGPAGLRETLATLPQCLNWQTAFQRVFENHFARPLDLEKWWALTVIEFLARESGPTWTPAYSASFLNELLTIPVEVRASSNSLPSHTEITLQDVVRKFTVDRQEGIFQARLHDLRLAQFRMSPRLIALTADYCHTLGVYLGEKAQNTGRHGSGRHAGSTAFTPREFIRQLDALDARRTALETALKQTEPAPANLTQDVSNL